MLFAAGCSGNAANTASNVAVEASTAPVDTSSAAPAASSSAAASSAAPSSAVGSSAAPAQFTDLSGVYGADKIEQLAQLQTFDIAGTTFQPNQPVLRREFVRWLYAANNAMQSDDAKKIHPAPPGEAPYFKDLPASDKDFAVIDGMQDAGISVGFPDKTFQPDVPITREQALAIALGVDCSYSGVWSTSPNEAYNYLPPWKDRATISKTYAPIIAACSDASQNIAGRVWGKSAVLRPQAKLTRAEAALVMWQTGARTAADALAASAAPSASPSP
jgi:hypothetical protein